jgi:rubredoxin
VTAGRIILRVREVLGSGVLLLEGRDGKLWKDHTRNCAPCHLPNIDGTVHPGTSHIPVGLRCRLCGSAKHAATMVICDICSTGWHLECLTPPLLEVLVGQWACPECVRHSTGQ